MQERPFWEQLYADMEVSTFSKGPKDSYDIVTSNLCIALHLRNKFIPYIFIW